MSHNYKKKQYDKICECCGKEFISNKPDVKYCFDEHYVKCEICGKEYHITRAMLLDRGPVGTCSRKCASAKAKRTMLDKYGVENVTQLDSVQEKIKQTNLERYGTEHPMQSDVVKEKVKNTNLERYGVENTFQAEEFKQKIEETNLERYGVRRPLQNKYIIEKTIETNQERYGGNSPLCSKEVQEKARQTNLKNLGVDWPGLSEECNERARQTCLDLYGNEHYTKSDAYQERVPELVEKAQKTLIERYGTKTYSESEDFRLHEEDIKQKRKDTIVDKYGVDGYSLSKEFRQQFMNDPSKIDKWMKFIDEPVKYIQSHYEEKPTIYRLQEDLGVRASTIDRYIHTCDLFDYVSLHKSTLEQEIIELLRYYEPNIKIKSNTRTIISPMEIDIYLPEYKIGIECNPTVTHNSSIAYLPNGIAKESTYHKHKSDLADKNGIFLFHLFGYEWSINQDIIKSMVCNLINKVENTIFAKECKVKEISDVESSEFLNENHLDGNSKSDIKLGLYHNNSLVSLMTFIQGNTDCYTLSRFCNKLNTEVADSEHTLFKYFLEKYNPLEIYSSTDRAHESGSIMKELGFEEIKRTNPNYRWINYKTDIPFNGIEQTKETMIDDGYVQVFDSGSIEWKFINK